MRAHGARLVGPNCLGIAVAGAAAERDVRAARASRRARSASRRRAARSASRCSRRPTARGLGLSAFVSIGNKADVSSNDLLEYWEDDAATELVAALPRVVRQPAQVRAHRAPGRAREADPGDEERDDARPAPRAASSHTAALAGSDAAVDALFRQAGVIRARHARGAARRRRAALDASRCRAGRRVAVLTNAGGLGILCADACEAAGLELPALGETTRDALRGAAAGRGERRPTRSTCSARRRPRRYEAALPLVLGDPGVDAVIVLFVPPVVRDAATRSRRAIAARRAGDGPTSRCSPSS